MKKFRKIRILDLCIRLYVCPQSLNQDVPENRAGSVGHCEFLLPVTTCNSQQFRALSVNLLCKGIDWGQIRNERGCPVVSK